MNRLTVCLLAALDAVIVAAIGLGVTLVPATLLWAVQYHLALDWGAFWRGAADVWLVGHGVGVTVSLDAAQAAALGATGAMRFGITAAALGFAVLTVLLGARTGRRVATTEHPVVGAAASVLTYALIATLVALTAQAGPAVPVLWQGMLLPAAVFSVGLAAGWAGVALRSGVAAGRFGPGRGFSPRTRMLLAESLRTGGMSAFGFLAASAVVLTLLLAGNYARVVGLYESVQAGALGAFVLTLASLALLPNAVIWTGSWLAGPGFAVGTGSSVSPIGSQVGPLPSFPLLGVLPQGAIPLGFIGLAVPLCAAFLGAQLSRARLAREGGRAATAENRRPVPATGDLVLIALGGAAVAAIGLGILAWASAGAIGPGRLVDTGPDAWRVGLAVFATFAIGGTVGILTITRRERRPAAERPRVGAADRG